MNASILLFGLLPLIAFVIVDSFAGVRSGVIAGVLFAIAEAAYTLIVYKTVDELTIGTLVLVLIFGFLSYKSKKDIYFKLQPVVLGVLFAIVLFVMQALGKPLLVMMIQKYQLMFPEEVRELMLSEANLRVMEKLSSILGFGFLIHAALVAYSAFRMNKWWWLIIRGIGFYLMLIVCTVIATVTV
jgi:intracellular septation protein